MSTWSTTGTRRRYRPMALATAALLLAGLALSACGSDDDEDEDGDKDAANAATASCATLPAADTASVLPSDFPLPDGATAYSHATQGATKIEYVHVSGTKDDLPDIRDKEIAALVSAGYKKGDSDQEEGSEADGDFTGPHEGNVNVRPATDCAGYVTVRITLES